MKIKNKDLLIRIFKTISWLDKQRWNKENQREFINFFKNSLTNCEKILTHWICYITDRQMPFEIVWDKGGYVFSELVYEYSRNGLQPKQLLKKHYGDYKENGKNKTGFKSSNPNHNFISRFHSVDRQNILRTLEILDMCEVTINGKKYKRNIVAFILHFIHRFKDEDDLLIRVSCALHLLTYQHNGNGKKANPDKVIEILKNNEKFEEKLKEFKKTSTTGKKRLWCCVRDYKKGLYHEKIFNNAIKEVVPISSNAEELITMWNNLPMDQIELPGDVWNNNPLFRNNLFAEVLDFDSVPKRKNGDLKWGMSKIIREIYNQLKSDEDVKDFYPEQFDITFDFVPRMCSKKMCKVCLFGKNGVEFICIPTRDKYCPVALLSCGYIAKCVGDACILKEGISKISKGICKGD